MGPKSDFPIVRKGEGGGSKEKNNSDYVTIPASIFTLNATLCYLDRWFLETVLE